MPAVKAEPQIKAATHQALAKADRLPLAAKGAACASLGWPNYEAICQFDMRRRPARCGPSGSSRFDKAQDIEGETVAQFC